MRKVIVVSGEGNLVQEIDDTGFVNDESKLIWDEKEYGPIPLEFLENYQGLVRDADGEVTLDHGKLAEFKLREREKEERKVNRRKLVAEAEEFLQSVNIDDNLDPVVAALVVLARRG
jgi:predicted house-cleaning noncanonical NTP pyrophosphatase (MazG superfamily)